MPSGHIGVVLFFVISGYLITTLLLKEQKTHNKISIRNFYIRRILRILPLYYLILILSFVLLGSGMTNQTLFLCFSIFPNIAFSLNIEWIASPQIWSIGVEEQFYIIWPSLIKFVRSKLLSVLIIIIVGYTLLPHVLLFLANKFSFYDAHFADIVTRFFFTAKFNCMAIGGLLAYLSQKENIGIRFIRRPIISFFIILMPFLLWAVGFQIPYINDELFALLFCLLIANLTHKKSVVFDNPVISYVGKISYGIYMYHWLIIIFTIRAVMPLFKTSPISANIILYSSVLLLTMTISSISYHTFEYYFLSKKRRFERV